MAVNTLLENDLCAYVDDHRDRLVQIIRDLVRIPSENTPPTGSEEASQRYVEAFVQGLGGWDASLYYLDQVPGLADHPLYWPGRDYRRRPNVGARKKGRGAGRSLVLSGHIDAVPRGTQPWTRDPFGGEIEGNRLYGRGSNDMKAGVASHLFVLEALSKLGIELCGDLVFETVADEEFAGVNGTIAGRLQGFNGDADVISEPTFLEICPAQRGLRLAHITLRASGGILKEGKFPSGVIPQLRSFMAQVDDFAAARLKKASVHDLYKLTPDPVPVSITKIVTAPWGTGEPITIPETCQIELYWQLMPGERQEDIERQFVGWLDNLVAAEPDLFPKRPDFEFFARYMPGSATEASHPLVEQLAAAAEIALGKKPRIVGFQAPCDMYIFQQEFGIPAVLWGPSGGNTHAADEYVDLDSAVAVAKGLLLFACNWCGITGSARK